MHFQCGLPPTPRRGSTELWPSCINAGIVFSALLSGVSSLFTILFNFVPSALHRGATALFMEQFRLIKDTTGAKQWPAGPIVSGGLRVDGWGCGTRGCRWACHGGCELAVSQCRTHRAPASASPTDTVSKSTCGRLPAGGLAWTPGLRWWGQLQWRALLASLPAHHIQPLPSSLATRQHLGFAPCSSFPPLPTHHHPPAWVSCTS